MAPVRRGAASTIASELLVSSALLFGAALLVAVLAAVLMLPTLASPGAATLFLVLLLVADLAILWVFLRHLLGQSVLHPLEEIGAHAERIAAGDYEHRIPGTGRQELDRLVDSVNTMAGRLIRDQRLLAENVRSLEAANRELVATTDELIRTARMASVGTLAAGIAHEIGNPLGALRGSLEAGRGRAESGGDVTEALELALEEAARIDAIVRSVLEFARSAPGDGAAGWVRLPVAASARSAVELLERRGALDGVAVEIEDRGDAPPVRVRPQLLEQVLVNLLVNAAQACRAAGTVGEEGAPGIRLRLRGGEAPSEGRLPRREDDPPGADFSHKRRLARLREGEPAGELPGPMTEAVLEILDRGTGIGEADLERIFDPFFTTRPPGEGTGMGLAITTRIVQELGGRLEAENREGGGACFRLRLPGAERVETNPGRAGSGEPSSGTRAPEAREVPGD